jgi:hypothetical protein
MTEPAVPGSAENNADDTTGTSSIGIKAALTQLVAEIESELKQLSATAVPAAQNTAQQVLTVLRDKFASLLAKL